jgi:myo-inositol-1(or 4)-monophosphatase
MSTNPANVDHAALERVIRRAGDKLLELWPGRARGRTLKSERKADGSLVTEADFASHHIITEELRRMFPADFILSEEEIDAAGFARAETAWILDPLDGTEVYARGQDYFAIFLSRRVRGEITEGIMYYPELGHYFQASKGRGATRDGVVLKVSSAATVLRPDSVFADGLAANSAPHWCQGARYPVCTRAFMGLCAGEIDGVVVKFSSGTFYPWDFAPGALIIEESGGRLSDERNQSVGMHSAAIAARYLVASNGALHERVLALISGAE